MLSETSKDFNDLYSSFQDAVNAYISSYTIMLNPSLLVKNSILLNNNLKTELLEFFKTLKKTDITFFNREVYKKTIMCYFYSQKPYGLTIDTLLPKFLKSNFYIEHNLSKNKELENKYIQYLHNIAAILHEVIEKEFPFVCNFKKLLQRFLDI
jgi:hypothetical protein